MLTYTLWTYITYEYAKICIVVSNGIIVIMITETQFDHFATFWMSDLSFELIMIGWNDALLTTDFHHDWVYEP